jgi:hypothetical protein
MQSRYDAGRVWLDLADAARATRNHVAVAEHCERARRRFIDLHVPRWAERAATRAATV